MYKKKNPLTLASRIFTIQLGDAILFAVHTVYEQACTSISSVRFVVKYAEACLKKKKIIIIMRGCAIHLNFFRITK